MIFFYICQFPEILKSFLFHRYSIIFRFFNGLVFNLTRIIFLRYQSDLCRILLTWKGISNNI